MVPGSPFESPERGEALRPDERAALANTLAAVAAVFCSTACGCWLLWIPALGLGVAAVFLGRAAIAAGCVGPARILARNGMALGGAISLMSAAILLGVLSYAAGALYLMAAAP